MSPTVIALIAACLIWWFSTGAILIAVRLAEKKGARAGFWTTIATLPVAVIGAWGLFQSFGIHNLQGIYVGFLSAITLWGWVELSFLTGSLTGPVRSSCPGHVVGWPRFWRAWGTIAHHEIALTLILIAVIEFGWGAANAVGVWTFVILYFARVSAKLNLFLGVAHVNTEFLPQHLSHLPSYFGKARLNWLFPVSVTLMTFALGCFIERLINAPDVASEAGFALLAALTALALLEHWFLVLRLPDAKLWRWMLPDPTPVSRLKPTERSHEI